MLERFAGTHKVLQRHRVARQWPEIQVNTVRKTCLGFIANSWWRTFNLMSPYFCVSQIVSLYHIINCKKACNCALCSGKFQYSLFLFTLTTVHCAWKGTKATIKISPKIKSNPTHPYFKKTGSKCLYTCLLTTLSTCSTESVISLDTVVFLVAKNDQCFLQVEKHTHRSRANYAQKVQKVRKQSPLTFLGIQGDDELCVPALTASH